MKDGVLGLTGSVLPLPPFLLRNRTVVLKRWKVAEALSPVQQRIRQVLIIGYRLRFFVSPPYWVSEKRCRTQGRAEVVAGRRVAET